MGDFPLIRGRRLRATRTDGCGNPVLGPDSRIVTRGFITMTLTPNNTTTDAISVVNANGEECVGEPASSKFANFGVAGTFCKVMPEFFSMITGMPVVRDAAGLEAIGLDFDSAIDIDLSGVALELWSAVPQGACDASGNVEYGYFVMPFAKGGTLSAISIENGAITFGIEGLTTRDGNQWGAGPYDVELDEFGVPGPLNDPLTSTKHLRMIKVGVAPPAETDGAEALGVPATGATAGSPAALTPSNSYAPASFATIGGLTATPNTAWTTGQYVLLRDGSRAYWDGDSWNAGVAP
jgi:hypothetical protein